MTIFYKKNRFSLHCLALIAFIAATLPSFAQTVPSDTAVEQAKKAILDDPLFLNQLRDRLSVESVEADGIRKIVRSYLIEHPEIIFEMQEALNARNEERTAQNQKNQTEIIKKSSNQLFHSPDDLILGNPDGDVTIVEFYDYNCGYCKRSFPALQKLIKTDPKVRLVVKDYPILGEDSYQAHLVARAFQKLMPQKYRLFHEKLMTYNGRSTEKSAVEVARSLGADENRLRTMMQDKKLQEPLIKNAEIAYTLGINYTPSYIVGTRVLPGALDADAFAAIVREERKKGK